MRRRILSLLVGACAFGVTATTRGQFSDVVIDPALGHRPTFGPGGYISNGNSYGAYGPRGYGYYTGLYLPPNDLGNGPSPYYSPIFSAMVGAPSPNAPTGRAGWRLSPSLPFTGRTNLRLFRRQRGQAVAGAASQVPPRPR